MIRLNVTLPTLPVASGNVIGRIRTRFQHEAGTMILDAVRSLLGTNTLYTLSPEYAKSKRRSSKLRRVAGKPADQPLILTSEMFDSLTVIPSGDGFIVQVEDGQALSKSGFDYAEMWESGAGSSHPGVQYLEKGLALVEDQLDEVLAGIIEQEMLL